MLPSLRLGFIVLVLIWLTPAVTQAELTIARPVVDVGDALCGAPLSQRFEYRNSGTQAIAIADVRASCGCLKPAVSPTTLAPGETGCVCLEVNTLTQPVGPNSWRVYLSYRDGEVERQATLELRARLGLEVSVQPPMLLLQGDGPLEHDVLIQDRRARPLAVTEVRTSSPRLIGQLGEKYTDALARTVHKVRVGIAADCPAGRYDEMLSVFTSDPTYPELKVPVTLVRRARRAITFLPDHVDLRGVGSEPLPTRRVLLRDEENRPIEVARIRPSHPAIRCTWAKSDGADAYTVLAVTVDRAQVPAGGLKGTIQVEIVLPMPLTLEIPITCQVP